MNNYTLEDVALWLVNAGKISELQAQIMLADAVTEDKLPEIVK